jgi:hypothetical protein
MIVQVDYFKEHVRLPQIDVFKVQQSRNQEPWKRGERFHGVHTPGADLVELARYLGHKRGL